MRTPAAMENPPRPERLLFIDNIRWSMILLVLSMHAVDTYSPFGSWYYRDGAPVTLTTALIFGGYQSWLQAFFMALLFFIAGYFAKASYDRKGCAHFLRDRALRLGVPTLVYMGVIGPFTQYFLSRTWGTGGFLHQLRTHIQDGQILSETGPMWFAAALLLFSVTYAIWRTVTKPGSNADSNRDPTSFLWRHGLVGFLLALACTTFALRVFIPEDTVVLNVHPGDFPSYVLMFAAGTWASRHRLLESLPDRAARVWATVLLLAAVPTFAALLILGGALEADTARYSGGANLVSFGKCVWESLVCTGAALALIVIYREHFRRQGWLARFLSENAFAVYLIHPPIVIALGMALHPVTATVLVKAALLMAMSSVVTFPAAAITVRKIPLLRRLL